MSKELTRDELLHLYSLAIKEVQSPRESNQDNYDYERHIGYWDNLADKLRIIYEDKVAE
jgi:hypothetical protein